MPIRFHLLFCLFFFSTLTIYAQQTITITGLITDKTSGDALPMAAVYAPALSKGVSADFDGKYTISLPATNDTIRLRFSFAGYASVFRLITADQDQRVDVVLASEILEEVVIVGEETFKEQIQSTSMSVEKLDIKDIRKLPVIFGEVDIIKAMQLKPGIMSGNEGSSALYVRGGGPDQNLFLYDNTLLYNPSHLLGFFSTFNGDVVQGVDLYKGSFPAQYGGRLSSVVDVSSRKGNSEKTVIQGGLGLISSRLAIEGPVDKEGRLTYLLAGRRTYFDVFTRIYNRTADKTPDFEPIPDYYFYDMNGRMDFKFDDRNDFFVSAYHGRDVFGVQREQIGVDFSWGNSMVNFSWRHRLSETLVSTTSLNYTRYGYDNQSYFDVFRFELDAGISDYTFSTDFTYVPDDKQEIRFGVQTVYHDYNTGRINVNNQDDNIFYTDRFLNARSYATYFSDDITLSARWKVNAGLRLSAFERSEIFYGGVEPRAAVRFLINEETSIKASYARMYQYAHLVTTFGASLPTDIWYPSGQGVLPQIADQYGLGFSTGFGKGKYLFSNEYFYKNMQQLVDFKDGADLVGNPQLLDEFIFGKGWAYGTEFYLEKAKGKTTGWIGYTLAWTQRQFAEANSGQPFYPRYDRRHDISVVLMHDFNERWTVSGTWIYGTGNAVTLPTGRYFNQGLLGEQSSPPGVSILPVFEDRSNYRMAAFHRGDFSVTYNFKPKRGESSLVLSVYNAYDRRNPFFIYFDPIYEDNVNDEGFIVDIQAKQQSLFPVLPSLTYNFKF